MSEDWKLTDERIDEVLAQCRALPCPDSAYCPDEESLLRFNLRIIGEKALTELRTLRAAMPTEEEREALEEMAETVRGMFHGQPQAALALAALAKLTKETP